MTKKAVRKTAKKRLVVRKPVAKLSADQWNAPAGFHAHEIRRATLEEVVNPQVPTKNLPELSSAEIYDLAVTRLSLEAPNFQVAVMGFGLIDKARALAEIRARTKLGKHLAVLQMYSVRSLVDLALREKSRKGTQ
jgi:hypothetical protein